MFYCLIRSCFYLLFRLLYRLKIKGAGRIPEGAAIIAPNHISYFDPPIVGASYRQKLHFLAKKSLFQQPLLGLIIRNLNSHPVDEERGNIDAVRIICKLLEKGEKVVVFPEGERSWDDNLLPIKSGVGMMAIRSKCPIVPVFIKGAHTVWPRNRRFPKPWGRISCTFGEPIPWEQYAHLPKKEAQEALSQELHRAMEKMRVEEKD